MTRPDDLQKGQYIVLTECLDASAYCPFDYYRDEHVPPRFDGRPLEIVELSLPFCCVTNGSHTLAIDLRAWAVQRVSRAYAAAMAQAARQQPGVVSESPRGKRRRGSIFAPHTARIESDPRDCPRCGDRMVQTRGEHSTTWTLACKRCGHNGGPVIVTT